MVSGLVTSLPFHLTKDLVTTLNQHGVENSAFRIIQMLLILTGRLLGTSHLLVFRVICAEMFTSSFRGLVLIWTYVLVQNTVSLNFHTLSFWINWPTLLCIILWHCCHIPTQAFCKSVNTHFELLYSYVPCQPLVQVQQ